MIELRHTLNRGVDKRDMFLDDQDYFRFIHNLYEFNDQDWVSTPSYAFSKYADIEYRQLRNPKKRKLLVDIHAFALMKNHYHLLLSERVENGIPGFMRKVNMGYSKYFNQKYDRKGTLFEGRYKSVPVTNDAHFLYLPYYIHLNPLDFVAPTWRERELKDYKKAFEFIENYKWSSFPDYIGKKNFPSVTSRGFLLKFFDGPVQYKKDILAWLKEMNLSGIQDILLE